MPTMNVSLPRELAAFVEDEVASGGSTASEVVRDALRLLRREREEYERKMAILRREIQVGLNDIDAGRISTRTVEEIAADVLARHRAHGGT